MNEGRTTAIFGVVAAVAFGLAWWSRPEAISNESDARKERVGQDVFPSFSDPAAASSLQIIKYDEDIAQLKQFEVAREKSSGLWTLPSNEDYPADAAEQVRDATTPLIGLKVLSIESFDRGDHELYGVVNPDDEELIVGESGVGFLVSLKDNDDQALASLIIGKEVQQAEGQRYVRIPTEDAVYTVELDTAAFTTEFQDWIESDLLGVRSFDITQVGVRDYSLQMSSLTTMSLKRNFDAQVSFDPSSSQWSLDKFAIYEGRDPIDSQLAENEELNTKFLNDFRNAVQDLEIVDVKRKPEGLASDLKADESLLNDRESVASLQTQGFYPVGDAQGMEIFASGGETIIGTTDGVNYLLRFGEVLDVLSNDEGGGLSRYLLVTAKLNDAKFPPPDLELVPETVEEMLAMEAAEQEAAENPAQADPMPVPGATDVKVEEEKEAADDAASETPAEKPEGEPAVDPKSEEEPAQEESSSADNPKEDETAAEETTEEADSTPADSTSEPSGGDEDDLNDCFAQEENQQADEAQATDEPEQADQASKKPSEDSAAEAPQSSDPQQQPAEDVPAETGETEEELKERLEAMREKITKENQRKLDERNEKIDAARKKVQELNARFADWYYVVSDEVYKKLKVSREQLIQDKNAAADAATPPVGLPGGIPGLPQGIGLPPGQ